MTFFLAGKCECGSTRPRVKSAWVKSARVNSARLYPILPTIFTAIFIRDKYEVCFIYKNVQQKFEGIMLGSIYIAGLSILFHSTGPTS